MCGSLSSLEERILLGKPCSGSWLYPFQSSVLTTLPGATIGIGHWVGSNAVNFRIIPFSKQRHPGGSRGPESLKNLDSGHSTRLMALSKPKGFRRNDGKELISGLNAGHG